MKTIIRIYQSINLIRLSIVYSLLVIIHFSSFGQNYQWKNVPIGGGGYMTGIAIHPTVPDLVYARTDVGGLYRWDASGKQWIPLFDWVSPDESNLYGIDGVAVDKNNPDVVYVAAGKYAAYSTSGIYKSIDKGKNWTKVFNTRFNANRKLRWLGECIAVDPNNSNIVYCGTRADGLQKTLNGGTNWSMLSSVPSGEVGIASDYWTNEPIGIRAVVVDPSTQVNGRSKFVYAVVWGKGIYQSSDGGETFSLMVGSPLNTHRIALDSNNTLYVSHETGVKKYDGSQWSDLTIPTNGGWTYFNGIDVDPFNQNNIVVSTGYWNWWQRIYLSKDGGSTWSPMDAFTNTVIHDNTWHSGNKGFFFAATSCVLFDPHHQGKVWLGDWYQVWQTPNIYASPAHWYNEVKGNEALVNVAISCPPSGASVFTGHADVNGFRHSNLDSLPQIRFSQTAAECTGIDYVEKNPNYMAAVLADDWYGLNTIIQTSQDNGVTWQKVSIPAGSKSGKIACNPTDPLKMVYLPSNSVPYYTIDGGNTWTISNGAPSNAINSNYIFELVVPLAVNRSASNTYYLYVSNSIYESTNGGANWSKVSQTALPAITGTDFANFKSGFGTNSNELWLSLGSSGLWRSQDAGKTFAKINYFSNARMMAWGKSMPGSQNSTLFVYGVANGIWGVYRSTDLGVIWKRINSDSEMMGDEPTFLEGDRQTAGRVYVGTNGRGVFYGEPSITTSVESDETKDTKEGNAFIFLQSDKGLRIVATESNEQNELLVLDVLGRILYQSNFKGETTISQEKLNQGLFFVQIVTGNKRMVETRHALSLP